MSSFEIEEDLTQDPDESRHTRMGDDLQEAILKVIELRPSYLSKFEKDILNDRLKAIQEYRDAAVVTVKQRNILLAIVRKVKRIEQARRLEPL